MGIFKKIGKGIKTGFKSIGKKLRKAYKSFGKFMGKIGILGQIGMMLILPAIGTALMGAMGSMFSTVVGQTGAQAASAAATSAAAGTATASQVALNTAVAAGGTTASAATAAAGSGLLGATGAGVGGTVMRGAGAVLKAAGNFAQVGGNAFSTVTEGISTFIGELGKGALNKAGISIEGAAANLGEAWQNVQTNVEMNIGKTTSAFTKAFKSPTAVPELASSVPTTTVPAPDAQTGGGTGASFGESARNVAIKRSTEAVTQLAKTPAVTELNAVSTYPGDILRAQQSAMGGTDAVTAQLAKTPVDPSLLARVGTALQDLPKQIKTAAAAKIESFPGEVVDSIAGMPDAYLKQGLNNLISGSAATPQYNTNNSGIAIAPQAEFTGGATVALPTPADVQFPYGNNAVLYGQNQNSYGFPSGLIG